MSYAIEFSETARRSFLELPEKIKRQMAARIDGLAGEPRPRSSKKLRDTDNVYRIRSGSYRVVYSIDDDVLLVLILRIGHRKSICRGL
jgi:mRNA interferase RelE/StbE